MDKSIVVASAIATQLHHEGRWPPNNVNKIIGSDYHYNRNSFELFLTAVRWKLQPDYVFDYDDAFVIKHLSSSVSILIGAAIAETNTAGA